MTSAFWFLMLAVAANALVFHFMPRFSRPDILFGVTVPEAFVANGGRTLVSRFRVIVWVSAAATAIAIGLSLQAPEDESGFAAMLPIVVMTGGIVVTHAAWQWARSRPRTSWCTQAKP